jgi:phosphate transport system permease protein
VVVTSSAATLGATRTAVERSLRRRRSDLRGRLFSAGLLVTLLVALGVLVLLLVTTIEQAWPVLSERGSTFLNDDASSLASRAGVRQGLVGSLVLTAFVAAVALPIGVAAAIYLQEYARDTRVNRMAIANIRNLAGVPSIVYGILGLVVFVQALRPITGPSSYGRSYLSGGLTLAVLVMPIVILVTMEALRAVPGSIREAAYGVGATRWEAIRSHVLPYATPGVFTGVILSLARAFGETAPLLLVGAVTGYLNAPGGQGPIEVLQGPYTSLPTLIFGWARQPGEDWKANTAAAIVVLLVAILVVNGLAIALRNRYDRRW